MTRTFQTCTLGCGRDALKSRWIQHGSADATTQVLALHMLGLSADSIDKMALALVNRRPDVAVHAYDQRGHGSARRQPPRSFDHWVDDAMSAVAKLDSQRVHLVGSSMGGAVAAEAVSRLPAARIASVTLIATPVRGIPAFAERGCARKDRGFSKVIAATLDRWFGNAACEAERAFSAQSISGMTLEGWDASWKSLSQFRGFDALPAKLPPTQCLAFSDDLSTPVSHLDEIAQTLERQGTLVQRSNIPGAGHAGLIVRPEAVAESVDGFLQEYPE